ncbi:hypothetical protein LOD99_12050 [Oopsacas minuta]|uniref:Uncharacterized protein n=1 Tax=Oopsacas minuta TaxID=111878 RepID=A0AAV7JHC0_9METZ|nr:hypothetical protein LOD99_12050 [Oopsacas minuta]
MEKSVKTTQLTYHEYFGKAIWPSTPNNDFLSNSNALNNNTVDNSRDHNGPDFENSSIKENNQKYVISGNDQKRSEIYKKRIKRKEEMEIKAVLDKDIGDNSSLYLDLKSFLQIVEEDPNQSDQSDETYESKSIPQSLSDQNRRIIPTSLEWAIDMA